MTRTLHVGALQLRAHDRRDFPELRAELLRRIEDACANVDLLVVPESTFPAYVLGDATVDDTLVEEALLALRDLAVRTRTVIVTGAAIRRDARLYNAALVLDLDGTVAGIAEKIFLWHFDRKWFAPGERLSPIRTSVGTLGVFVCADGRMPGIARALVDRGAELLVMPTAWVTSGRDPHHLENVQADLLARVRAFENGVPFIAANKCGVERSMVAYCGKSQIIDAHGTVLAIANERDAERVAATLTLNTPAPKRATWNTPTPRASRTDNAIRVALSIDPLPDDIDARIALLDADVAIAPGDRARVAHLDRFVPTIAVDAEHALDPTCLLAHRRCGYRVAIIEANDASPWNETIARARALELRMFVIVFDRAVHRAYAIDPDGALIAGTFDDYRLASFALDVRRTNATAVAPGTDVADGIERVQLLSRVTAET